MEKNDECIFSPIEKKGKTVGFNIKNHKFGYEEGTCKKCGLSFYTINMELKKLIPRDKGYKLKMGTLKKEFMK